MIDLFGVLMTPFQLVYGIGMLLVACCLVYSRKAIVHALEGDSYKIFFTVLAGTVLWPVLLAVFVWIIWHGYDTDIGEEGLREDDEDIR